MTLLDQFHLLIHLTGEYVRLVELERGRGYLTMDEKETLKKVKPALKKIIASQPMAKQLTIG